MPGLFFRDGIISAAAERVTAQHPENCQGKSFYHAKTFDHLQSIIGACGDILAARAFHWGNIPLIHSDQPKERLFHRKIPASLSCRDIARQTSVLFTVGVLPRATKIKSYPGRTSFASIRNASRITRRERLLFTAFPIFLLVVIPMRRSPERFFNTYVTRHGETKDLPFAYTRRKSLFSQIEQKTSIKIIPLPPVQLSGGFFTQKLRFPSRPPGEDGPQSRPAGTSAGRAAGNARRGGAPYTGTPALRPVRIQCSQARRKHPRR